VHLLSTSQQMHDRVAQFWSQLESLCLCSTLWSSGTGCKPQVHIASTCREMNNVQVPSGSAHTCGYCWSHTGVILSILISNLGQHVTASPLELLGGLCQRHGNAVRPDAPVLDMHLHSANSSISINNNNNNRRSSSQCIISSSSSQRSSKAVTSTLLSLLP
jgi:hypothetical protein